MTTRSDRQSPGAQTDQDCCTGDRYSAGRRRVCPRTLQPSDDSTGSFRRRDSRPSCTSGAVIALLISAGTLPPRPTLIVDGVAAAAGGLWCIGNFWRCRHAYCLVTGIGWSALGLFAFVEAGIGLSLISGDEQPVLLAVLVAGLAFEAWWTMGMPPTR
jgi:hypothetical protein